jgi:hypothetical protein
MLLLQRMYVHPNIMLILFFSSSNIYLITMMENLFLSSSNIYFYAQLAIVFVESNV